MDEKYLKSIALMVLCTFMLAIGQITLKSGVNSPIRQTMILYLGVGFLLYTAAGFLLTFSLKNADLSIIYPLISLSIVWVTILSVSLLAETLTWPQYSAIFLVFVGVGLVGKGGLV